LPLTPANAGTDCGKGNGFENNGKASPSCGDDGECFLAGTRLATPRGYIAIENLRIGDRVLNHKGVPKTIRWVAWRELRRGPNGRWIGGRAPIKISKFTVGGYAPRADLYLSPGHALFLEGVLIPAANLVNGVTIVADATLNLDVLTYFHVELETHEAILAEGLPVESFLGTNRRNFDNAGEYRHLYGQLDAPLTPLAPTIYLAGRRAELASRLRRLMAPVCDKRTPADRARDLIANSLANSLKSAA
jgi:hypothetical protein